MFSCAAETAVPGSSQSQSQTGVCPAPARPCMYDRDQGSVPDCMCNVNGVLSILPQHIAHLDFDSHGLAVVYSDGHEGWMYVNRSGTVLVTNVASMDNGADWFHDGLVRFLRDGKYGFANRSGNVVIPPTFDGALNFERGRAPVCRGCRSERLEGGSIFVDGDWFFISRKGRILRRTTWRGVLKWYEESGKRSHPASSL